MSSTSRPFVTVAGIDFSPISIRALDEAIAITALRGGEVHVIYVEPETPPDLLLMAPVLAQETSFEPTVEKVQRVAQERIDAVPSLSGALKRVVAHLRRGSPAPAIAEFAASLDADLVVVGSHGRRGAERFFLGSVAERVAHLARCPVWIVRPKDHAAELKVPQIEPPCPDCLARREATNGAELWCARHAERHPRAHRYAYVQDGLHAPETRAYESTPE
ncbi:Universal stress protein family protein [Minicystis rosea]|nr:Universal stress protein family protein [Minicystis rosea]